MKQIIIKEELLKDSLNSEIWINSNNHFSLKKEVRKHLLDIAKNFIDFIDLDGIKIKDVLFSGSLANFNWTNSSDIDLHILMDIYNFVDGDKKEEELITNFLIAKSSIWNNNHDVTIKGFDVEVFSKEDETPRKSKSVYSVLNNKWIVEPKKQNVEVDFVLIKHKVDSIIKGINNISKIDNLQVKYKKSSELKKKIKKLRQVGLDKEGEYSIENLIFKTLRKSGSIDKLDKMSKEAFDKSLSLDEEDITEEYIYSSNLNESIVREDKKTTLSEAAKKDVKKKYDFACLMADFYFKGWKNALNIIDPEDVYTEDGLGLETESHVTILYGLHDDKETFEKIREIVKRYQKTPIKIQLKNITIFENEKFDVVKFDVISKDLKKLNKKVSELPHTSTFPDYHAHMTIAYVKKGCGKKYIKKLKTPLEFYGYNLSYSMPNGSKIKWVAFDKNTLGIETGLDITDEKIEIIKKFINFTAEKLNIKKPLKVFLHKERDEYIGTTAAYHPDTDENHIRYGGRAMVDVCRSIGHELTHQKQLEAGVFKLGDKVQNIGGKIENQANEIAGILIKDFAINFGNDSLYEF